MGSIRLCFLMVLSAFSLATGVIYDRKTIKVGADIALKCESDFPVHWCFPPTYETPDGSEFVVYVSQNVSEYSKNIQYEATLTVKSADYMYTGFYHCMKNDTDSPCNRDVDETVKSTYVYVEDAENLIAIKGYKTLHVHINDSAVLPCLPTSPNVVMKLTRNEEEVKVGVQPESDTTVTYDPTIGYIIKPFTVRDSGDYFCQAKLKNKEEELICDVRIANADRVRQLVVPTIRRLSKAVKQTYIHDGDNLTMVCESSQKTNFKIEWKYPEETKPQVEVRNCQEPFVTCTSNSTLTIHRVRYNDSGEYTCLVSARGLKRIRTTVKVQVVAKGVKINEDSDGNVGSKMAVPFVQNTCFIFLMHFTLNCLKHITS